MGCQYRLRMTERRGATTGRELACDRCHHRVVPTAPDGGGVLVRSVQDGSPAAQAGLRANDLIVAVGRTPVSNTKSFREAGKGLNLLLLNVRRGSATVLIPIR